MKVTIDSDEWYPVLIPSIDTRGKYDIPPDRYGWIKEAFENFNRVQSYLEGLCQD